MAIKVVRSENTKAFIEALNEAARKYGIIYRSLEGRLVDLETGSSEFVYLTRKLKKVPPNDLVQTDTPTSQASMPKAKPQAKVISFKDKQRVNKFYWKDGTITDTQLVLGYGEGGKVLHRVDGPAVEYASGDTRVHKSWHIDGKLHRVDGPAVEYSSGERHWYIDGEKYAEEQFSQLIKEAKALPLALKLTDSREWVRRIA